ncbi:hypothetical protein OG884_05955 [Streptosporangium sp. NBC_01755]|uniref:hypothetical protein n=1 Tax=Streptosporangium sp. NBC_01755 TaxID=2975949 RepID=UPI002DDB9024|nr:hypothetical protein [Streptosporangium sp. NBC_01755]WSD01470.1 hypothetical protein OG884_05955 [Streptosporangium sp. NBC_01755]
MEQKRVTVLHNRDARRDSLYLPADHLAEVYSRLLSSDWSLWTPDLLAESLFWVFRAQEPRELLTLSAKEQALNSAYRNRRLRPFVRGDVLVIGNQAFACEPWGRALPVDRNALKIVTRLADTRRERRTAARAR